MKAKIVLLCITSIILASIPVSANAYDLTTTIKPTGRQWEWGNQTWWMETQQNGDGEYNWQTTNDAIYWGRFINNNRADNTWILKGVASGSNIDFKKDKYYKTTLQMTIQGYTYNNVNYPLQIPQINRIILPNNAPYELISVEPITQGCYEGVIGDSTTQINGSLMVGTTNEYIGCYKGSIRYEFILKALRDDTGKLQLGNGSGWFLQSYIGVGKGWNLGFVFPEVITEFEATDATVINQQQQQAGEQAQNDGQQGASTSETDATQGTQSLLSAITGFVGIISNATPTNCKITGDMGALDLGTLDFCQDNPPAIITTIGTLILIGITIPLVIWVVKKIISMFRSFTNG